MGDKGAPKEKAGLKPTPGVVASGKGRFWRESRREEWEERRVSRTEVKRCMRRALGGVETASKKSSLLVEPVGVDTFELSVG